MLCLVWSVVQFVFVLLFSFFFRLVALFVFWYLCWLVVVASVAVYCVKSDIFWFCEQLPSCFLNSVFHFSFVRVIFVCLSFGCFVIIFMCCFFGRLLRRYRFSALSQLFLFLCSAAIISCLISFLLLVCVNFVRPVFGSLVLFVCLCF